MSKENNSNSTASGFPASEGSIPKESFLNDKDVKSDNDLNEINNLNNNAEEENLPRGAFGKKIGDTKRICLCEAVSAESKGYLKQPAFNNFKADILLGIGGLGNLDLALTQHPEKLLLCDFDENLVEFWNLFKNLIQKYDNKATFLTKLTDEMLKQKFECANIDDYEKSLEIIEEDSVSFFSDEQNSEDSELNSTKNVEDGILEKNVESIYEYMSSSSWYKNDNNFRFIKDLFTKTDGVEILKIDICKEDELNLIKNKIEEFHQSFESRKNPEVKLMINLKNVLDFTLGRSQLEYCPGKTYKNPTYDYANNGRIMMDFLKSIDGTYNNNNSGQVLILDAFRRRSDSDIFHTALVTPNDLMLMRNLNPDNDPNKFKEISGHYGHSQTSQNVQRIIGDNESLLDPRSTIERLSGAISSRLWKATNDKPRT